MNYFHKFSETVSETEFFPKTRFLCVICFICLGAFFLVEQACAQKATSSFLRINVDARGTAMGGAQGASTNDVYAVYWNPAGLSKVLLREIAFTRQNMFQGLTYNFLGYAMPTHSYGTLAGQLFLLSSGEITSTLENPDGSFGGIGDSFSVSDFGLGFSQSKAIMKNISYGVSLKFLSHRIADESALSIAIDGGLLYQTMIERLRLGVALQNLSTQYSFINQKLSEPWNIKFAALYIFSDRPLFLTTDFNHISGQQDTLNIGAEYWYLDLIALRAGMKLPPPAGFLSTFSMGFGVNWRDLYQLDYSFSPHRPLGTSQCFSMFIRF
jgi:hypothetical protein